MDIGSIFPLYDSDLKVLPENSGCYSTDGKILFSLCREALFAMACSLEKSEKMVLLPAYTCDTVITPFKELGWKCYYYNINLHLRIDTQSVLDLFDRFHPALIVVHPYYGKDLNEEEIELLDIIHKRGCRVAVDLTQCIFSTQRLLCVDYYLGSYRKWHAIPDGGYLEPRNGIIISDVDLQENEEYEILQRDAMYLRGLYFKIGNEELKSISRRINKKADGMVESNIVPHKISALSLNLLKNVDLKYNQQRRFSNYQYLLDNIQENDDCKVLCNNMAEVTTAPLYFMLDVENRSELQVKLAEHHIYAPVLWPVVYEEVLVNDSVKHLYEHLLAIPIDQRYDEKDMQKVVELINN
jgi:hypothetical protein